MGSITDAVVPVAEAAPRPLIAGLASSSAIWEGESRQWTVQMLNAARDNLSGAAIDAAQKGGGYTEDAIAFTLAAAEAEACVAN